MRASRPPVQKVASKSDCIAFGGSSASWSLTRAASTLSVHDSPSTKSCVGLSVKVVGPPLVVAACGPLTRHARLNQSAASPTGSLKTTVIDASSAASTDPLAGVTLMTTGAGSPHRCTAAALLRGAGGATAKSAALLSASRQPACARATAVVLPGAGVGPGPSKSVLPAP